MVSEKESSKFRHKRSSGKKIGGTQLTTCGKGECGWSGNLHLSTGLCQWSVRSVGSTQ